MVPQNRFCYDISYPSYSELTITVALIVTLTIHPMKLCMVVHNILENNLQQCIEVSRPDFLWLQPPSGVVAPQSRGYQSWLFLTVPSPCSTLSAIRPYQFNIYLLGPTNLVHTVVRWMQLLLLHSLMYEKRPPELHRIVSCSRRD